MSITELEKRGSAVEPERAMRLFVVVERPDGTTFKQEVAVHCDEGAEEAVARYRKMLGCGYLVCDWYFNLYR